MENDEMELGERRYEASIAMEMDVLSAEAAAVRLADRLMADPVFFIAVDCGDGDGMKMVYEVDKRDGKATFIRYEDPKDFVR
jgi:uncharacterized protein YgiB involved in biofilm formation